MSGERQKKGLWLDPRAKLFLILICVLASMFAPSLAYQFALVVLIAILGTFFGKWKYVIKAVCFYAVICVLTVWIMAEMTGTLRTMFIAFLGLFHKVYACGMLAGIVLSTTKVNEFLSAMNRVLILICVLASMFAPSLAYQFALVVLIAILGTFFGKWKYVIKAVCFYAVICVLTVWIMAEMTGTLRTMFIAFLGLFHKVYACGMLAGIVLSTTKVNEFLSAMNRVHAPKKLVIPLAVMLRYIPTIQEDWRYIKDAMRMRDVSPSLGGFLSHPGMTVECIYVPLMMTASKAADELSIASVTRGIENPNPRTCLVQIKCGIADWMIMAVAVAFLIFELCVRGGVIG